MAPELVKREIYDERVDIWALGVLTYVLMSAIQPFGQNTVTKIHSKVLQKQVSFDNLCWAHISDNAKDFIT